jgi:multiple RNA-binding domain-containing protein 1
VINENIEYFASHGIDMTTLFHDVTSDSNTKKRSSTKILVKNLPYCDHAVQNDAKRAFRSLAYKRFKNVPLYLEWAPLATFRSSKEDSNVTSKPLDESSGKGTASGNANAILTNNDSMTISKATKEGVSNDHDDEEYDNNVTYSIYVKIFNFATKEESLKKLFETIIPVRTVRIPTKLAPLKVVQYPELTKSSRATERQSMGFGSFSLLYFSSP